MINNLSYSDFGSAEKVNFQKQLELFLLSSYRIQ